MDNSNTERAAWLGVMARNPGPLVALCENAGLPQQFDWLRAPEIGTVMVRGRIGGTGAPFNLGEITVTRAVLRLPDGPVGHGQVQGRDKAAARCAALVDALMQTDAAAQMRAAVLDPLVADETARRGARAEKAAATRVEFFTLVRGEDQ